MATEHARQTLATSVGDDRMSAAVRPDIAASWQRSVRSGLTPGELAVPYDADVDADGLLARVATPVLDDLVDDLDGTNVAVLLTDVDGQIAGRWVAHRGLRADLDRIWLAPGFVYAEDAVGTNAIGTALASRKASMVAGAEHFADALTRMACAATPITDPKTGGVVGVIDLTSRARDANPLMLVLARRAGRDIEQRLLEDAGDPGQVVSLRLVSTVTDTERNVALLAAEGLSNREIGERLFMSRFTVDTHLRSVFRKLGVHRRVELAQRISQLA